MSAVTNFARNGRTKALLELADEERALYSIAGDIAVTPRCGIQGLSQRTGPQRHLPQPAVKPLYNQKSPSHENCFVLDPSPPG
jgi:hypothetical protein